MPSIAQSIEGKSLHCYAIQSDSLFIQVILCKEDL